MVRSDIASSGVMFSIDTESGFKDAVFLTAAYGLGEKLDEMADVLYDFSESLSFKQLWLLKLILGKPELILYKHIILYFR